MSKNNKEIERVWILSELPSTELITHSIPHTIGYLFNNDNGEMRIVKRVKSLGNSYSITIKSCGTLIRDEWEDDNLPEWAYKALWSNVRFSVNKTRHFISYNKFCLEVDEYHDRFKRINGSIDVIDDVKGKIRLECEFSSYDEANHFVLPSWAINALEVTHLPEFRNAAIAENGWPKLK